MNEIERNKGCIFNIQRMSLHDGPGIRTTVFMKGCNLRCFWCHNPESWETSPVIQFYPNKCIRCMACANVCPIDLHHFNGIHTYKREECIACGKCASACPSGSLILAGCMMTVEEVIAEVKRDMPFFEESNGGVTLSGGEPLVQPKFTIELLKNLKEAGISTAIESAFHIKWDIIKEAVDFVDFFLIDMKLADSVKHKSVTGVSNDLIIKNILSLDLTGAAYCIRIPIIPEVNDNEDSIDHIYDILLKELKNVQYVELMPYHALGESKYLSLGIDGQSNGTKAPKRDLLAALANRLIQHEIVVRY